MLFRIPEFKKNHKIKQIKVIQAILWVWFAEMVSFEKVHDCMYSVSKWKKELNIFKSNAFLP